MSTITHFTTMEDAYYYFFQAKGTSETPHGASFKQRHLRTAALLGWVAVDDAVASFTLQWKLLWSRSCRGPALLPRLLYICGHLGGPAPDPAVFKRHRDLRNGIAHPGGIADTPITVEQVDELLAYCKRTIRIMYPRLVIGEEWKGHLCGFL
jgi:hypothetical protein